MRIALAQTNPTVGDIAGNCRRIAALIDQARAQGAALVVFPELAVIGYPPKDLLLKPAVIEDCVRAVADLAGRCTGIAAIIGYPCPADAPRGRTLYNAAAFCQDGRITHRHVKSLLPTYDVFDEHRYFEPGPPVDLTPFAGGKLGISICEDLWNDQHVVSRQLYHDNPIDQLAAQGASVFINCSASPFVVRKHEFRKRLMSHTAKTHRLPLLYCNQVGGNDELVFDGCSCAFDAEGNLIAQAKDFEEDLLLVEIGQGSGVRGQESGVRGQEAGVRGQEAARAEPFGAGSPAPTMTRDPGCGSPTICNLKSEICNRLEVPSSGVASAYHALVLGLGDYCRKCRFKSIVLGLSGGIDSALTAVLAVAAIGAENVRGVAMPSRFSSDHSINDARDLAARLGIKFHVIPIADPHAAFEKLLTPHFEGRPPDGADTTGENIQARIRGVILMALSNKFGSLLVTTGNKSELAVGYCTLYGDMCGGLAVISDVPKTLVWEMARWVNSPASPMHAQYGKAVIPDNSIAKPPSAELRPNQTDQDSLPPYEVLDQIIERYVERDQPLAQIVKELPKVEPQVIYKMTRLIDLNEYKRKQAAPGIKVTGRAFGFGRRMPIAQRYENGRPKA